MLVLHILSFGFVLGITAIADKDAFLWLRGKKRVLERKTLRNYHLMIWLGLISLTISGFYLFYPMRLFLLSNLLFDVKLLFVAILFANAILIGRLMNLALTRPFAALTRNEKLSLVLSGAISAFSWFCASAIALWIF
ncbi:MAG: hypothetical protein G01um10148_1008 [Parcubacteria group bacterium Gr01-1014_8]|nr:MAG: hypothetical protein G01um10148_1008 [Parcubacteria group bacterium Gr01-1014_8]